MLLLFIGFVHQGLAQSTTTLVVSTEGTIVCLYGPNNTPILYPVASHNNSQQITRIGQSVINYSSKGKIERIGRISIRYVLSGDNEGKIEWIGRVRFIYSNFSNRKGKIERVANQLLHYDSAGRLQKFARFFDQQDNIELLITPVTHYN